MNSLPDTRQPDIKETLSFDGRVDPIYPARVAPRWNLLLPLEMRTEVWRYLLDMSRVREGNVYNFHMNVTRLNREIHDETTQILHASNAFIEIRDASGMRSHGEFLRRIPCFIPIFTHPGLLRLSPARLRIELQNVGFPHCDQCFRRESTPGRSRTTCHMLRQDLEQFLQFYRTFPYSHKGIRGGRGGTLILSSPENDTLFFRRVMSTHGARTNKFSVFFQRCQYGAFRTREQDTILTLFKQAVGLHEVHISGADSIDLAREVANVMQPHVFWRRAMGFVFLHLIRSWKRTLDAHSIDRNKIVRQEYSSLEEIIRQSRFYVDLILGPPVILDLRDWLAGAVAIAFDLEIIASRLSSYSNDHGFPVHSGCTATKLLGYLGGGNEPARQEVAKWNLRNRFEWIKTMPPRYHWDCSEILSMLERLVGEEYARGLGSDPELRHYYRDQSLHSRTCATPMVGCGRRVVPPVLDRYQPPVRYFVTSVLYFPDLQKPSEFVGWQDSNHILKEIPHMATKT